jgi:hypothetical protein
MANWVVCLPMAQMILITMDSMQSNKMSKKAPNLPEQTTTSVPETNPAAEATAQEITHEGMREDPLSSSMPWLEAASTSPGERPTVLFNASAVNYIEIRSWLAGNEQCRVVFTNGSEYVLHDAERAGNFLHQLREQGIWQPAEAGKTAEPPAAAAAAGD